MFNNFKNPKVSNDQLNSLLEDAYQKDPRNPWFKKTEKTIKFFLTVLLSIFPFIILMIFFPTVGDTQLLGSESAATLNAWAKLPTRIGIVMDRGVGIGISLALPFVASIVAFLLGKTKSKFIGIDLVPIVFSVSVATIAIYLIPNYEIFIRFFIAFAIFIPSIAFAQLFLMIYGTVKSLKDMQKQFQGSTPEEKAQAKEKQEMIQREMEMFQKRIREQMKSKSFTNKKNDYDSNDDSNTNSGGTIPKNDNSRNSGSSSSNQKNPYGNDDEIVDVKDEDKK